MEKENRYGLGSLLNILPPVEFCCVYGSTLHAVNHHESSMVDYILGVRDPEQWHYENLKINRVHYSSWMVNLGGARLITEFADKIGVGVHFNPFVSLNNKMFKYGVVRMDDLIRDILNWNKFYVSGRLQKPVHILVDNLGIENLNFTNLRAATSAALLLLPSEFTKEDLYCKICNLSYMGDLRMLFAEDRNKVKKIVHGQFDLFQNMYKPFLEEWATKDLLRFSSSNDYRGNISQDCSLSAASTLVSSLPLMLRSHIGMALGREEKLKDSGRPVREVVLGSKREVADCLQKILRKKVMVSSARQAAAGLLTAGAVHGIRYLVKKVHKAWKSWT